MKKIIKTILPALLLVLMFSTTCFAEEGLKVMQVQNPDGLPSVYVKGIDGEVTGADAMIGNVECPSVTPVPVNEEDVSIRTLFLVDNSISIPEGKRDFMKSIIAEIIAGRDKAEEFAVATFSEEISMIAEFSNDYSALKSAVDGIEFADQETYLTDVLYSLIADDKFNEDPDKVYRRIVIFSDGVDNKSIGITTEELNALLAESGLPIYSVGIYNSRQTNADGIEKMFSISRQTNAETFLLDEIENELEVVNKLAEDRNIVRFDVVPEAEAKDGSKKSVTLNIHMSSGDTSVNVDNVRMAQEAQKVEEPAEEPEEESVIFKPQKEEPAEEEQKDDSDKTMAIVFIIITALVVVVILVVIVLLIVNMLKKKREENEFREVDPFDVVLPPIRNAVDSTEVMGGATNSKRISNGTVIIMDDKRNYNITLTDIASPARSFSRSINDRLIIGRSSAKADICIDYDQSVSSAHCAIEQRNNKFYLVDLQSSNGTYLNNNRVLSDIEIVSGCTIKLGRVEMRVEIS
ncbi:MAG: FHA domain-containing protein [Lachnospiraceae bacterium]|nr:FHA domain-containing protein [Lachnospiraceae bacterium]